MPLYAFGSNGSGQLGVGHISDFSHPEEVLGSSSWHVEQLAAGGNHTVIICSDGNVRATGNNEDSRSGICGRTTNQFMVLPLWERGYDSFAIEQIACTWSATFLLTADGSVLSFGTGDSGELGLGAGKTNVQIARRIPDFPPTDTKVTHIAACMGHVVAVLSNGEVYGWGKGRKGQLGQPEVDLWSPRRIEGLGFFAEEAVCGKDFTAVFGTKSCGKMTILGPNRGDRFGIRTSPPSVHSGWIHVAASWGSVYHVELNGNVEAWGRDDHGQLPPPGLPYIESIAAGSEHVLALTKSSKVLAWGWGEHGNCGGPTDERGDVKGTWNDITISGRATAVFAGCATSFIQI